MTTDAPNPPNVSPLEPPPDAATLTDVDRLYATLYLRLLDADAAGVEWKTASRQILHLDPTDNDDHAKRVFDRFLARAKWMTQVGYALLLKTET
ncbi:MAG: DUF2285 domain-containing protein [Hyphomicrobium aestuarii]|nr:DUF2285 domain-containing protein [Hyphomicrobium aestuarii]